MALHTFLDQFGNKLFIVIECFYSSNLSYQCKVYDFHELFFVKDLKQREFSELTAAQE